MLEGLHWEPVEGPVQSGRICSTTLAATLGMGSGARAAQGDQLGVTTAGSRWWAGSVLSDALGCGRLPSQSKHSPSAC